ncbi:hypothetical protein FNF27_01561 [Cafeteria roenbergensis]|uniref:Uncharacterized protein n=1 Tax=Cafeteria roenbergensis TaxID=33653 RepID=A0A5A8EGP7_CAFRO|nr:hypothetical protein FNF27_01561 [Cafeteria roenbergensis]
MRIADLLELFRPQSARLKATVKTTRVTSRPDAASSGLLVESPISSARLASSLTEPGSEVDNSFTDRSAMP